MIASGCLFFDGKSILLLKRSYDSSYANYWGLPGGKLEKGETKLKAAVRECEEEIGTFPYNSKLLFSFDEGRWTTFAYRTNKFNVKLNDEHTNYKWVKLKDLNNYTLHPGLKQNINKYIKKLEHHVD